MRESATTTTASNETSTTPTGQVGALIVGGEHPGLGVARSLGRRGIPVCVVDDQQSVARFSKYVTHFVRVNDLRDERKTVDAVLDVGRRLNLKNWVLYPTRDETVAAFSRYRADLAEFFRVTTPDWNSTQWAWNKKQTCMNPRGAVRHTMSANLQRPRNADGLADALEPYLPLLAIKPAVKENFFSTPPAPKPGAWKRWIQLRGDVRERLLRKFEPRRFCCNRSFLATGVRYQVSYCCFFRDGEALWQIAGAAGSPASGREFRRARRRMWKPSICRRLKNSRNGFCEPSITMAWSRSSLSRTLGMGSISCWM